MLPCSYSVEWAVLLLACVVSLAGCGKSAGAAVAGRVTLDGNDPTLVTAKEAVPSKYNSKSELVVEIKPGQNAADFELKSK
jgi:hypothetical protein